MPPVTNDPIDASLPDWVPPSARAYVAHAFQGRALRDVAQETGRAASTIMRQIRKIEQRRDDPLMDDIMERLGRATIERPANTEPKDASSMSALPHPETLIDDDTLNREAKRVLRRLCEGDAFMAVGHGMPQAVILRDIGETPTRTAILSKSVAQAFVLKDWVSCFRAGKITRYRITDAGRAALKRLLTETLSARQEARGMAEASSPFLTQHMDIVDRVAPTGETMRVNLAESPLGGLARKKDRDGKPFLAMDLVMAGERLREDFERAQMGPRVGQKLGTGFLTPGDRGTRAAINPAGGPDDAPRTGEPGVARAWTGIGRRGAAGLLFP